MGGCSRSSASPHVDGSLAQAICRGDPARSDPHERFSSSSPPTYGSFALPLELVRPARTQCLVGATPTAHQSCWRSRFSDQQLNKEERVNTTAFSMMDSLPSKLIVRAERPLLFLASSSNHLLSLYCSLAYSSLRIPWEEPQIKLNDTHVRFFELKRGRTSPNELADREPHANREPICSCGLVMVLRKMHSRLPSRIYNNGAHTSACGAAFSGAFGSIPNIGADFLHGSPKSVEVGPKLPSRA